MLGCVFGPCAPGLGQRGSSDHDTTRDIVCDFYFDSSGQPDSTHTEGRDYPSEIPIFQRGSLQKSHEKVEQAPFPQHSKPKSIFMIAASSPKIQVIASDGAQSGDIVCFDYNGVEYDVVVPEGVFAGMRFMADVSPPSETAIFKRGSHVSPPSPETAIFQRGSPQSNATLSKLLRRRTAASSKVQVIVSDGTQPGDLVRFDYNGLEYDVVVPDGVFAGMRFMADVAPPSTTDVEPSSLSHTVATVSAAVVCVKVWVKSVTLSAAVVISCAPVIVQRLAKRCRRSRHASV